MIVLGIDPGTAETGYGVIAVQGCGCARSTWRDHHARPARRSSSAWRDLRRVAGLIERHQPDEVALEDLYVGGNPRTILSVGHARGAVLTACGRAGLPAAGYPPAEVKMTVCGFGRADKDAGAADGDGALLRSTCPPETDHAPTPWRWPCATPRRAPVRRG